MKYTYHYEFHPHGTTVSKEDRTISHIWVDNGNTLEVGLFDHHQNNTYSCSVEAIVQHPELLAPLVPSDAFTFHTHEYPDTDALFAIYLIQYYLEHRNTANEVTSCFPKTFIQIVDYVKAVDSGHIGIIQDINEPLVSLYCIITCIFKLQPDMQKATQKALTVIGQAVLQAENATLEMPFDFFYSPINKVNCQRELKLANEDYAKYLDDKKNICTITKCHLPMTNDTISSGKVDTIIWSSQPTCEFNRIWARMEGYVLTIVPMASIGEYSNVIISLNPTCNEGRDFSYSLLPIARYLELYEQEKETSVLHENGSHKRNHSAPRGYRDNQNSLFLQSPFAETSDPWFVNSDYTLIAAPHTGSTLTLSEITETVISFADCRMNGFQTKIVVPFHFGMEHYRELTSILKKSSIDEPSVEPEFPYFQPNKRYFNPMLEQYSHEKGNFTYLQLSTGEHILQQLHKINDTFDYSKQMEVMIFPYGVGFFILTASEDYKSNPISSFAAIESLIHFRIQMDLHFRTILSPKSNGFTQGLPENLITIMNPHFYTGVKLTPENSAITNSTVIKYASTLCSVNEDMSCESQAVSFNYRQHIAYSRIGCSFVSTTYDTENTVGLLWEKEWFFLYLLTLEQRYVLLECKRQLIAFKLNEKKRIRELREMLIEFSSNGYFSTAVDDEFMDKIYREILENVFMVSELKEQVLNQLEQLSAYHEGKVTAALDKISVWLLPFMVISTILQCSLITMEPLVGISEKGFPFALIGNIQALLGWGIMLFLVVFLFVILKLTSRHRK